MDTCHGIPDTYHDVLDGRQVTQLPVVILAEHPPYCAFLSTLAHEDAHHRTSECPPYLA